MPKKSEESWGPIAPGRVGDIDPAAMLDIPADALPRPRSPQQMAIEGEIVAVPGPGGADPKATRGVHPSGIGAAKHDMMVEIQACGSCGAWFPRDCGEPASAECPRCFFAKGLPPLSDQARAAMERLRWRLNEYRAVRERDRAKEHAAFVDYSDAAYLCAPILLGFLEALYGDQVLRGVQEIVSG